MSKLFKSWWFWLTMFFHGVSLIIFIVNKEFCAALWLCAATYWFVSYMLEAEENHDLRMDNLKLTIHLLETTELLAKATMEFGKVEENIASTLLSTDYKEPQVVCYENHANDSRITESNDVSPLLSSRAGTGGGNLPLVQECYAVDKRNQSLDVEVSNSLTTCSGGDNYGTIMQECYAIDSVHSNSMKSANPHSGFHKEEIAKTLDTTDPNPTKNQGGNVIVNAVAIAENIIGRADNQGGNGVGAQEELAYTQNATGMMGVCTKGNGDAFESDVHTSLSASGGGQAGQGYPCARIASTVRRLLPVECERLMGFPDNHTKIAWKGKSADECPDSPRYKAAGNSMCVNVMQWIGEQIERVERKYANE